MLQAAFFRQVQWAHLILQVAFLGKCSGPIRYYRQLFQAAMVGPSHVIGSHFRQPQWTHPIYMQFFKWSPFYIIGSFFRPVKWTCPILQAALLNRFNKPIQCYRQLFLGRCSEPIRYYRQLFQAGAVGPFNIIGSCFRQLWLAHPMLSATNLGSHSGPIPYICSFLSRAHSILWAAFLGR